MSLRPDSLAQILSYSNAYPGCTTCVFDDGGIITSSLIERLGGSGRVICVFPGQDPPHAQLVNKFNFGVREQSVLEYASAYEIFGDERGGKDISEEEKVKIREQVRQQFVKGRQFAVDANSNANSLCSSLVVGLACAPDGPHGAAPHGGLRDGRCQVRLSRETRREVHPQALQAGEGRG